jgi:hypothetical protein
MSAIPIFSQNLGGKRDGSIPLLIEALLRGALSSPSAAWNHARALVPAQVNGRGARSFLALQLGAGSEKGQNSALVPWTIA